MTLAGFFFLCMLAGLIYAVISAIMGGIFSGSESGGPHIDVSTDPTGDHLPMTGEIQFSPLSPVVIAVFVTTFGAAGLVCTKGMQLAAFPSVSIASIFGFGSSAVAYLIFSYIYKRTQGSSEARAEEIIGLSAELLTPCGGEQLGEIAYVQKGSRYTSMARSIDGKRIERNTAVNIVRVVGGVCYIRSEGEKTG